MVSVELHSCGVSLLVILDNTMEAHSLGFHSQVFTVVGWEKPGATVDETVDSKNLVAVAKYRQTVAFNFTVVDSQNQWISLSYYLKCTVVNPPEFLNLIIYLSNSNLCTIKINIWFESIWKVKGDNKYVFCLLAAWRILSSLFNTSVAIVSCWSLGLLGDGCYYQPQKMCLVWSPKLPPEEWATWVVLVGSRLSHISVLIRFWLSVFDICMYHWETKKLICEKLDKLFPARNAVKLITY